MGLTRPAGGRVPLGLSRWVGVLLAAAGTWGAAAQAAAPVAPTLTGADAAAELRAVARLIESVHPALQAYEPSGALQARAAALESALRAAPQVHPLAYGRALHALLAPVGDSHLAVALPVYG